MWILLSFQKKDLILFVTILLNGTKIQTHTTSTQGSKAVSQHATSNLEQRHLTSVTKQVPMCLLRTIDLKL